MVVLCENFCFFKLKTAYDMRISDWSSDVCSSDLVQLVEYRFVEPPTSVLRIEDKIRVELCLNTRHRSAQASFVDYWTSEHYERIGELFVVPPTLDVAARADEDRTLSSLVCLLEEIGRAHV